ncbi:MAG: coenzyme F420-0:L-glutamate ligase [Chloroflexota bacterium]|nr:coenzyme F420-0:L-glutamate ligase [Chloroflexota bacterium]MBI5702742.1 coenzyme F420-0:L-glutamate ligase [Chloroflexota bacterium]
MPLTLTPLQHIPLIRHGDNLADILVSALHANDIKLADGDILVLTSKIVSKAEGRMVNLQAVTPSAAAVELGTRSEKDPRLCELILQESREVLRVRPGTVIVEHRLGFVCANAGIDHSNVDPAPSPDSPPPFSEKMGEGPGEGVLLLPLDPDASSRMIREKIETTTGKKIGVMIIDSHGRAWRIGTVGVCIGLSGVPAVVDERGWKDLFGYELKITIVGAADELAAAASLVMGQAAEGTPAVHVRGFPYPLREGSLKELLRPKEQDMFR